MLGSSALLAHAVFPSPSFAEEDDPFSDLRPPVAITRPLVIAYLTLGEAACRGLIGSLEARHLARP